MNCTQNFSSDSYIPDHSESLFHKTLVIREYQEFFLKKKVAILNNPSLIYAGNLRNPQGKIMDFIDVLETPTSRFPPFSIFTLALAFLSSMQSVVLFIT